jgi:REP element-mobilizing transposase RayT
MARPLRIEFPHAYYHVTCRGNDRRSIYRDDRDRELFLEKLRISLDVYQVILHAYVLMGNHFHMIVETPRANLSEFMRHFNIGYTTAFNRRHRRVGHLYQGRYKAIVVQKDSYLAELSRYVHLNPVRIKPHKGKAVSEQRRFLERYKWSSLPGYWDPSKRHGWMNYQEVLAESGGTAGRYREFIDDGLREGYETPWEEVTGQVVLAREDFIAQLGKQVSLGGSRREQPSVKAFGTVGAEEILTIVSRHLKVKRAELAKRRTAFRDERAVAIDFLYRYGAMKQGEIGKRLGGLDYSTVSRERTRLRERVNHDRTLEKTVREIEGILNSKIKI